MARYGTSSDAAETRRDQAAQGSHKSDSSRSGAFDPLRHYRAFEAIADEVRKRIADGQLAGGQRLPSERQLAEQFGVSRATLREAFRVLESMGLVESRMGSGRFVVPLAADDEGGAETSVDERALLAFLEFLLGIEPYLSALAVRRATPVDLARIEEALDATVIGSKETAVADVGFHLAVTEAAHNVVARDILHSERGGLYWADLWVSVLPAARAAIADEHRAVFEAIRARDEAGARAAMTRHLEAAMGRVRDASRLQASAPARAGRTADAAADAGEGAR